MARVTVEDCIPKVKNRFELVILGAHRARQICSGSPSPFKHNDKKDKEPVIALREIAEDYTTTDSLRGSVVKSYRRVHDQSELDLDQLDEELELELQDDVMERDVTEATIFPEESPSVHAEEEKI